MNAAARMFALGFMAALAMTGCTTTPDYPQPAPDKAQIVVKVTATPKVGAQGPRTEGQYDKESVEKGRRFTRVNYSKMDCIAVVVTPKSENLMDQLFSTTEIELTNAGFARDLCIAFVYGNPSIVFRNHRDTAVTLYGSLQGGNDQSPFEVKVPAYGRAQCSLPATGLYDVYCDEDENLFCQVIATNSFDSSLCESGGELFFNNLRPGEYQIEVYAPRLPVWRAKINTTAGKRETLYAEVTVNGLPKAK